MPAPNVMPRYTIQNDGLGPFAVFYCDRCGREYRSQPDVTGTIATDIGRQAVSGLFRNIPLVGGAIAQSVAGQDPRYTTTLTEAQLAKAWDQVKDRFRECPTCHQIVCLSDFDEQSGYCQEDSPRRNEMAEAEAEQAGRMVKGFAAALGLDQAFKEVGETVKQAGAAARSAAGQMARCPQDGHLAPPGTKFCPECGTPMVQPEAATCPQCGQPAAGAKFCPECGAKIEVIPAATVCSNCGAEVKGAKFCPECGTKV